MLDAPQLLKSLFDAALAAADPLKVVPTKGVSSQSAAAGTGVVPIPKQAIADVTMNFRADIFLLNSSSGQFCP